MGISYGINIIRIKKKESSGLKISVFFFFNMGYKKRIIMPKNKKWIFYTDFFKAFFKGLSNS